MEKPLKVLPWNQQLYSMQTAGNMRCEGLGRAMQLKTQGELQGNC